METTRTTWRPFQPKTTIVVIPAWKGPSSGWTATAGTWLLCITHYIWSAITHFQTMGERQNTPRNPHSLLRMPKALYLYVMILKSKDGRKMFRKSSLRRYACFQILLTRYLRSVWFSISLVLAVGNGLTFKYINTFLAVSKIFVYCVLIAMAGL